MFERTYTLTHTDPSSVRESTHSPTSCLGIESPKGNHNGNVVSYDFVWLSNLDWKAPTLGSNPYKLLFMVSLRQRISHNSLWLIYSSSHRFLLKDIALTLRLNYWLNGYVFIISRKRSDSLLKKVGKVVDEVVVKISDEVKSESQNTIPIFLLTLDTSI